MLHQVQHTNGVTYTIEREPASALDRPYRISTNRGLDTGIYAYDGAGNVKQIGTQDFRYDRFKRMTSGEVTVSGVDRIQSASYDVYNNLLSLTTNGSTLTTSINSATNRLTSFSATYDAAGNLTRQIRGSETHQYTYDPLGMPKYLQSTTDQAQVHLYDADDERLATYDCFPNVCSNPGWELRTTVRGLGGEPLREYSNRGTNGWQWVRDYVYGAGRMLAAAESDQQGGQNVYHFHPDHLGTPRQITNASGVQVGLHSYYPFGQEATDPAQTGFTKKFTGHERDTNGTGTAGDLDYMHTRYCSPTLGRFLSFDPIGGNPRAPQSWNRYAYALNSPMNYTDPMGMKPVATFKDEIFVFDSAPLGFEIPPWVLSNWFIDVSPHFNNSRFDFSGQRFPAWQGWDSRGCDEWCQIFAEVGQASTAANYGEFGAAGAFMGAILGPLFSKAPKGGMGEVKTLAGSAFEHSYKYHPRIRARALQDPKAHNFPYSFDDTILREVPLKQADGSLLYRKSGSLNGTEGVYEIAINQKTGTIFHRTFRGN